VAAIHREVPTIPLDPPRNGPDVTQIKKIRQHQSKVFCKRDFAKSREQEKIGYRSQNSTTLKKKKDMQ